MTDLVGYVVERVRALEAELAAAQRREMRWRALVDRVGGGHPELAGEIAAIEADSAFADPDDETDEPYSPTELAEMLRAIGDDSTSAIWPSADESVVIGGVPTVARARALLGDLRLIDGVEAVRLRQYNDGTLRLSVEHTLGPTLEKRIRELRGGA
jgi:hypothetical protein